MLVHIKVSDNLFFAKCANKGTLGFGETFKDKTRKGMGDLEDVTEFAPREMEINLLALYYNW